MEFDIVSIGDLIKNVGFPIFVTLYLMFKFEKTIKENTDATKAITVAIEKCRK